MSCCLEITSILFQVDHYFLFLVRYLGTFLTSNAYLIGWPWQCLYLSHTSISHIGWLTMNPCACIVITTTQIRKYVIIFILAVIANFHPYVLMSTIPLDDNVCVLLSPYCIIILCLYVGTNKLFSGIGIIHIYNTMTISI